MNRFVDKVVIVTGAGSGIGAATAQRFAAEGAKVVLAGRTRGKLDAVAKAFAADRALIREADVSDKGRWTASWPPQSSDSAGSTSS